MQFLLNARRALDGQASVRDKLHSNLQHSLQVAFFASLMGGVACFATSLFSRHCPDCIVFAKLMGGLLLMTSFCAGVMAYARRESTTTQTKVIMHPWSFSELIEVSLTTGTVTIGLGDIILVYGYHIMLLLDTIAALAGTLLLSESLAYVRSDTFLFWTLAATCTATLGGLAAFLTMIFLNLPYGIMEYGSMYLTNFGGALTSAGTHLKAKMNKA